MVAKPRVRVNKFGVVGADGLSNVVSGLGAGGSKTSGTFYSTESLVGMSDAAYRTSTWYGKILTIPVDDAVRKWRKWIGDKETVDQLVREEKRLRYRLVAREALLMSRHEGGAAIVVGGLPGAMTSPLPIDRVSKESVTYMHAVSRNDITYTEIDRDPMSVNYLRPKMWRMSVDGRPIDIHHSRVFPINGRVVPGSAGRRNDFWGESIWLHLADAVVAADSGAAIVSALMHEAKLDVVSIPNLATTLSTPGGEETIKNRWQVAARLKSIANILLIDGGPDGENTKEETWNQKQIRWDGLPDVLRILLTVLSGAADIPYTRLTGDQQKGLSNNDDGSLRNYYSSVNTRQVLEIEPMLAPLDEILIRSALGSKPEGLWYEWESLYELSDIDRAEVDKKDAETADLYSRSALVDIKALEKAVVTRMMESGRWPGIGPEDVAGGDGPLAAEAKLAAAQPGDDPTARQGPGATPTARRPSGALADDSSALQRAADAAPAPLYVSRRVLNGAEIVRWAESQGIQGIEDPSEMHVTIAYSRTPVDWMAMPESWSASIELPEGGPRQLDLFGSNQDVVVLRIKSSELEWRHTAFRDAGASWDWPDYRPHITIGSGGIPDGAVAYQGKIVLGPEVFETLEES